MGKAGPRPSQGHCSGASQCHELESPSAIPSGKVANETCEVRSVHVARNTPLGALIIGHERVAQTGHNLPGPGTAAQDRDDLPVIKIHKFE